MGNKNQYLLRDELVHTDTILTAAVKATPPAVVVALDWLVGIPLQKWVFAATLIYTCLQTFFLISDRLRLRNRRFRFRTRKEDQL